MALYTGMRNGELYALTWDKVDIANKQILVSCGWTNKDGYKDFTKSGDDRIVEIADNLVPILKELKLKQSDSIFVLPRIDKWDRGDQARILQAFLLPLGLPLVRFHDLRASWCTMMLSLGVELVKVMKMGGWKDLKVMQRYLRKAGVETKGITKDLKIHNHFTQTAQILSFKQEH
jgi:integrase